MTFSVDEDGRLLIDGTWDELDEFANRLRAILDKDETGIYTVGRIGAETWSALIIAEIHEEAV